ncbi:lymphocyte antigen 6 complex locus protein G6f isoform X1 [Psammomys obesus]|uniref:lymphocyte antigen 6 complex locus protein G6f isoform X1 n=1 Tax=Psammomys obesus TaxID=48139 RepID=UPI002453729F|nr:lymphocyte antigen 6 complex locus protein G6f isoform X1 [Psammomys obesus]
MCSPVKPVLGAEGSGGRTAGGRDDKGLRKAWPALDRHHRFSADSIQPIYVASGDSVELPCPSPPALRGGQLLTWFRSPAARSSTILVAQVQVDRPASALGKPENDSRFKVLGNYSLLLEGSRDEEAGRYWCTVMDQSHKYQNWRVYDVSVLKGAQFSVTSPDGPSCSALLCSVVPARRLDSVTWLEGRNPVRGHAQYFWGDGAALLLVCPAEGVPETRARRLRSIRCLLPQNKRLSFSLAASTEPPPAACASLPSWDVSWILVLLFTAGQGVAIIALSAVLWRRRARGSQDREPPVLHFKPEVQVYENIHLARLSPPTHKTR